MDESNLNQFELSSVLDWFVRKFAYDLSINGTLDFRVIRHPTTENTFDYFLNVFVQRIVRNLHNVYDKPTAQFISILYRSLSKLLRVKGCRRNGTTNWDIFVLFPHDAPHTCTYSCSITFSFYFPSCLKLFYIFHAHTCFFYQSESFVYRNSIKIEHL